MAAGAEHNAVGADSEPVPPPWPLPHFEALTRRQSIVAWLVGAALGVAVAAVAVALLAPTHWLL